MPEFSRLLQCFSRLMLLLGACSAMAQTRTLVTPTPTLTLRPTPTVATPATPTPTVNTPFTTTFRPILSTRPTATPTVTPSASAATSTTATRKPADTGEIHRWTDSQGKVQYGSVVPEQYRSTARKVDTRSNIVSSRVPASIAPAPQPQPEPSDATPTARAPVTEREKCEAAWQQYRQAEACFAQYRQGAASGAGPRSGNTLPAEALAKCQSLPEPAPCR